MVSTDRGFRPRTPRVPGTRRCHLRRGLFLGTVLSLTAAFPGVVLAQKSTSGTKSAAKATAKPAEARVARLVPDAIPVNPGDPIAIVNGEVVTRMQLADECVARRGKEILETLIAGKLIDQAVAARKLTISPQEIEDETQAIAQSMGTDKANWLRTLDKERGISPMQYKRDIVYRVLALRKLAESRVQVTDDDLKKAYEANYGEQLHYRVIMTANLQDSKAIWNEIKQNPTAFERIAREDKRSIDSESRPLGGLSLKPMARHAYPLNLSQAAFEQLIDGDLQDKDPSHKPKDGDISGPIQVSEGSWVILRREKVDPARTYDPENQQEKERFREILADVKLKDQMQKVYEEIVKNSTIENKLTGETRLAKEEENPAFRQDGEVKLMNNPPPTRVPSASQPGPNPGANGSAPTSPRP